MHECIYCQGVCDCDQDDTWLNTPDDCVGCQHEDCESSPEYWDRVEADDE